jgi:VanZ family protein
MALIITFSSIPSYEIPNLGGFDLAVKKLGHMAGYAILAAAYLYALGKERPRAPWLAWLLAVIFAASDELHQSFVPGRNAAWFDVIIDSVGAGLGILFWMRWSRTAANQRARAEPGHSPNSKSKS